MTGPRAFRGVPAFDPVMASFTAACVAGVAIGLFLDPKIHRAMETQEPAGDPERRPDLREVAIGERFGVGGQAIGKVVSGQRWSHVRESA